MPLKEIKEYLDQRSPEKLVVLLEKEETLLDAKIYKLNKMRDVIFEKKTNHAICDRNNPLPNWLGREG